MAQNGQSYQKQESSSVPIFQRMLHFIHEMNFIHSIFGLEMVWTIDSEASEWFLVSYLIQWVQGTEEPCGYTSNQ